MLFCTATLVQYPCAWNGAPFFTHVHGRDTLFIPLNYYEINRLFLSSPCKYPLVCMAALLCTVGMLHYHGNLASSSCCTYAHSWVCQGEGRLCSQPPAVLFPICHWGSHGSTEPSSHERRESKCFFQSCRGVLEGLSYDPASHPHPGVAEEPSPVPNPRTRRRCGGPSSILVPASL